MVQHDSPIPVDVRFLPTANDSSRLTGAVAIVIDVLRASTTIVHALAHGARAVIPVLEVEEAMQRAAQFEKRETLLGGERQGELIPGFQLDNSPFSYTPSLVRGKTIVFTTTNGTRALHRCTEAEQIFIGAMVNLNAVAKAVYESGRPIGIVCAGTERQITSEDVLTAGAIVDELERLSGDGLSLKDSAVIARDFYRHHSQTSGGLLRAFRESHGGRNLLDIGLPDDIERAATPNLFSIVPEFNKTTGTITAPAT